MFGLIGIIVFLLLQFSLIKGDKRYEVHTKTGGDFGASTDSDVYIRIFGCNGQKSTGVHELESGDNDFENGNLDKFSFDDPVDVGIPEFIKIKRTDSFLGKWKLQWVLVIYKQQRYLFNYHTWLPAKQWVRIYSRFATSARPLTYTYYLPSTQNICSDLIIKHALNPPTHSCESFNFKSLNFHFARHKGKCKTGYLLNSKDECIDIDECASQSPCKEKTVCKNTPGSFECRCNPGYEPKDRFSCKDINECFKENQCDFKTSTCVNQIGSYSCNCNPGFKKISQYHCADKDECTKGVHTCNSTTSTCSNLHGGYYCKCKTGYHQGRKLKLCIKDECSSLAVPYKTIIEPSRCTQERANYYGDVCTARCEIGYRLEKPEANSVTCGADGRWSGAAPRCTAIKCPALSAPYQGRLLPTSCTTDGHSYQGQCTYVCNQGYQLTGSPYRTCRADGSWTRSKPTCIKVVPKPWIRCPLDIMVDLLPGQKTADVSSLWKEPTYRGDILLVVPSTANANYRFPAGETKITWTTRNAAGSDNCSILVRVNDKEKPKIVMPCPASPVAVLTTSSSAQVTWKEPTFSDNVGVTKVTSTRKSGETFTLGSWNVYYTAYDQAGNRATCEFVVIVKLKVCPELNAPYGGKKLCSNFGQIKYCTITCPADKQIYQNPSKFSVWMCNKGIWDPSPNVPDCVAATLTTDTATCSSNRIKMNIVTSTETKKYCAECPRGTQTTTGACSPCPAGKYQDQHGKATCKDCPSGTSSSLEATGVEQCRVVCRPGHYSTDGMNPGCQLCPNDTYQSQPKSKSCNDCPAGTTTISPGRTKSEDCGANPVISRVTPQTNTIDERQSASISCFASGLPSPQLTIKFRRNIPPEFLGKESREWLRDSKGKIIGIKLTITSATFENSGNYECSAENPFGKATAVSKLTVNQVFGSGSGPSFDADILG